MYAEYNDSADPKRDWEFSVEFQPEEREEYAFYISVSEGQEQVCQEVPQQVKKARGRKAHRPGKKVHISLSQRSCY
jgi:hypothetical protein